MRNTARTMYGAPRGSLPRGSIAEAVVQAAKILGENGRGKDGLVRYLKHIAMRDPKSFVPLLLDVLALQGRTSVATKPEMIEYETAEELQAALRERGISVSLLRDSPKKAKLPQDAKAKQDHQERSTTIAEAVVLAAEAVGEDGRGKDGLVGYFKYIARRHPRSFGALSGRALALQMSGEVDEPAEVTYPTILLPKSLWRSCTATA
jgi:hypothetical protein